jgi:hypothetical protein
MDKIMQAVKYYQCPGCVVGKGIECYVKSNSGVGCDKHVAGTDLLPYVGRIFLGMPKGFCRMGFQDNLKINIFENKSQQEEVHVYNEFNVPVWKYQDKLGVIIRGYMPRLNYGFIHVILDCDIKLIDCLEITDTDLNDMD